MLLLAVAVLATIVAGNTVTYQYCQDNMCQTGCQTQNFQENACLQENGANATVELSCYRGPSMCADASTYSDPQCTVKTADLATVCNSCQNNYTFSCGALNGALFWVSNCTDAACQNCGGATIVPFNKCKLLQPGVYGLVKSVQKCTVVTWKTYANNNNCQGTPSQMQYWDNHCNSGVMFQCNSDRKRNVEGRIAGRRRRDD